MRKTFQVSVLILSLFFTPSSMAKNKGQVERAKKANTLSLQDPFALVEKIQLPNGMFVFLVQNNSVDLTSIRIDADVGFLDEKSPDWGVSHLLEHVLFRDKELKEEMSYLQLIKEAGGEANGETTEKMTSYYGSIPAEKGEWLFDVFTKMILTPQITDANVEKEKATVELERGRPSPIVEFLGFSIADKIKKIEYQPPTFWEREFSIPKDELFTRTEEQLSTRKLSASQVQNHYDKYYNAQNIRVFIAGNFDRNRINQILNNQWAEFRKGEKNDRQEPEPKLLEHPFIRRSVTSDTPNIEIGTKLWQADLKDRIIVDSYMEFLAHRLMKEIRNKKGQTYTALASTNTMKSVGYSTVEFETTRESFQENLALVRNYLDQELFAGKLTQDQFNEARQLYLDQYRLVGKEANTLMWLAKSYYDYEKDYGQFFSPVRMLNELSFDDYMKRLKMHFKDERRFLSVREPEYFFYMDTFFCIFAITLISFIGIRYSMVQPFFHDQVKWVRNVKYPPFKLAEVGALLIAVALYFPASYAFDRLWNEVDILQSHVLFSHYLNAVVEIFTACATILSVFAFLPSKLYVMNQKLVIKSKTYYSTHIPLMEISSIKTKSILTYPFPLKLWLWNVRHRLYYFDPMFWRKGLLIQLKNNKAYFVSVTQPESAKMELVKLISQFQTEKSTTSKPNLPIMDNPPQPPPEKTDKSKPIFKISS